MESKNSQSCVPLKVHKIENFFGSEFEFYTISLLVMLKDLGFVKKFFWLGHEWGRYDYSAKSETKQNRV